MQAELRTCIAVLVVAVLAKASCWLHGESLPRSHVKQLSRQLAGMKPRVAKAMHRVKIIRSSTLRRPISTFTERGERHLARPNWLHQLACRKKKKKKL